MNPDTDTAAALLAVLVSTLSQIGIPGVFVYAWWFERRAHEATTKAYQRDLRKAAGLTWAGDVIVPAAHDGGD
jgi:hypothetical protein